MEVHISKEAIKSILENHYKKQEDFDGKVTFQHYVGHVGYGTHIHDGVIVTTKITGTIDLLGEKVEVTKNIPEIELTELISAALEEQGYQTETVKLDTKLETNSHGYGQTEQEAQSTSFHGVIAKVQKNIKIKQKGR